MSQAGEKEKAEGHVTGEDGDEDGGGRKADSLELVKATRENSPERTSRAIGGTVGK